LVIDLGLYIEFLCSNQKLKILSKNKSMTTQKEENAIVGIVNGGSGSLHLSGKISAGLLGLDVQEFDNGLDRTLIAHGQLNSRKHYRGMFSHNNEQVVFAHVKDDDETTSFTLSDTEDPNIGNLTVWNGTSAPSHFRIDINHFLKTNNQKESILDGQGEYLDMVGKRNPPPIKGDELADVFGENEAFKLFMRGRPVHGHGIKARPINWKCTWTCFVPACGILCLFWRIQR
jgi:hypothetical protein